MKHVLMCILLLLHCQAIMAQTRPSLLDIKDVPVVTPQKFGAKGDGIADDAAPLQAWINHLVTSKASGFLTGTYRCGSAINLPGSVSIRGGGNTNTKIVFSTPSGTFTAAPATTAITLGSLASTIKPGDDFFDLAITPTTLQAGDIIGVLNTASYSLHPAREGYRTGELHKVVSISGSRVFVETPFQLEIPAIPATVVTKYPSITVELRGFSIENVATATVGCVTLENCVDSSLSDMRISGDSLHALELKNSYSFTLNSSICLSRGDSSYGNGYAFIINSSRGVRVGESYFKGCRKGVDLGGYNLVNMDVSIVDSALHAETDSAGGAQQGKGLSIHTNTIGVSVVGSTLQGVELSGDNTVISSCIIRGGQTNEGIIRADELLGNNHKIVNNQIAVEELGHAIYYLLYPGNRGGVLDISGNTITATFPATTTVSIYPAIHVLQLNGTEIDAYQSYRINGNTINGQAISGLSTAGFNGGIVFGKEAPIVAGTQPGMLEITNNTILSTHGKAISYDIDIPRFVTIANNTVAANYGVYLDFQAITLATSSVNVSNNNILGVNGDETIAPLTIKNWAGATVRVSNNTLSAITAISSMYAFNVGSIGFDNNYVHNVLTATNTRILTAGNIDNLWGFNNFTDGGKLVDVTTLGGVASSSVGSFVVDLP